MTGPLQALAEQLRAEDTPISPHVIESPPERETDLSDEYASVVESVREGYLLHYEEPRLLSGHDPDLACSPATTSTPSASSAWPRWAIPRRCSPWPI